MKRARAVQGDWLAQVVNFRYGPFRLMFSRMAWLRGIYDDSPRGRSEWTYRSVLWLGSLKIEVSHG